MADLINQRCHHAHHVAFGTGVKSCSSAGAGSYSYPVGAGATLGEVEAYLTLSVVSDPSKIRTCDTRFRKPLLYPLSYGAMPRLGPG